MIADAPTPDARRRVADAFVAKFLTKRSGSTPLEFVKVVVENTMGRLISGADRYVWIEQDTVRAALTAAGFRVRADRAGKELVNCGRLRVDRFGVLIAAKTSHTPQEEV